MKILICNDCGDLVVPEKLGQWNWCLCGNIGGMYASDGHFQMAVRVKESGRVLEVEDDVLHGNRETGVVAQQSPDGPKIENIGWETAREMYQWSGTGGSDTLVLDMAKVCGIIGSDDASPCFSEMVFELCFKADRENRNRLKKVFPIHVDMVDRFQLRDGVISHPQHPEIGQFWPAAGGKFQWVTGEDIKAQAEASRRMSRTLDSKRK